MSALKQLVFVGIGTGNPDHVTLEGIAAIRDADCVLIPHKGQAKDDLAEIRRALVRKVAPSTKVIEYEVPVRDAAMPYDLAVAEWHGKIADTWQGAIPADAGTVAFLVWGDPSLYDSSLRIAALMSSQPRTTVVPGITSLQVLTAAHCIPLNDINKPVLITTGRQLRDHGWPPGADRVAVMLDGACSFQHLDPSGATIWWGAFLGLPNALLKHGPLHEVSAEIVALRAKAREAHGWIMDTYLLARSDA